MGVGRAGDAMVVTGASTTGGRRFSTEMSVRGMQLMTSLN